MEEGEKQNGICWKKWDALCRSKWEGDIGCDMEVFNMALLAKLGWRLL